jgi:hypothetical protein
LLWSISKIIPIKTRPKGGFLLWSISKIIPIK